jgi:hypothetical protein
MSYLCWLCRCHHAAETTYPSGAVREIWLGALLSL